MITYSARMVTITERARTSPGPRLVRARVAVFVAFFATGLAIAAWVVNIPDIAATAGVGNAVLGTALLALGAGSIVSMQVAGYVAGWIGSRPTVLAGAVLLAAGLVLLTTAHGVVALVVALFVLGLGNGGIDVAMNDQAVVVQREYGRPVMSAFHALFSVGGAAGAAFGGAVHAVGADYRLGLWVVAGVTVVLGAVSTAGLLPRETAATDDGPGAQDVDPTRTPGTLRRRVVLLGALAFSFMLAEGMVNDWSALHATQHLGLDAAAASLPYLFFATVMTVGRLVADRAVAVVGPVRIVRWGAAVGALGLLVVVVSGWFPLTIAGWVLFGAGLAGIVPQLFTAAGGLAPGARGTVLLSRVVGAGYVGMLAGPAIIGWISAGTGIDLALVFPLLLVVAGAFGARLVGAPRGRTRRAADHP